MISFHNAITPTKLAEYFIQIFNNYHDPVERARELIIDKSRRLITEHTKQFKSETKLFQSVTRNMLQKNKNNLKIQVQSLLQQSIFRFRNEKQKRLQLFQKLSSGSLNFLKSKKRDIESVNKNIHNMSPENVLKRGYSITLLNGKSVKNAEDVKSGDILHTTLYQGNIKSVAENE